MILSPFEVLCTPPHCLIAEHDACVRGNKNNYDKYNPSISGNVRNRCNPYTTSSDDAAAAVIVDNGS